MKLNDIEQNISQSTDQPFVVDNQGTIGGGCINTAMKLSGSGRSYFLKLNNANRLSMFEAEAAGLDELAQAKAVRVPKPVCSGISDSKAYIVLEHLEMGGSARGVMDTFAVQLAQMHRYTNDRFGWWRENTIGSTPQENSWANDWIEFYARSRLRPQIEMAAGRGIATATVDKTNRIIDQLADYFNGYQPAASLLHGDLWSGNYGVMNSGEPVIFDPATYYGDREADLAMSELFGGFGGEFYAAYDDAWPVDAGYSVRKTLYNLYHILNHFNMFGGGYGAQADSMASQLLAEIV